MRPASEIHSALDLIESDLSQGVTSHDGLSQTNLLIAREVLAWVAGSRQWSEIVDGPHAWLCGYLIDDPPQIVDAPPEAN